MSRAKDSQYFVYRDTVIFIFARSRERRARPESIRRKRFSVVSRWRTSARRGTVFRQCHYFRRYFAPALPIIPRLIAGETDFSRHVDFAGATNEFSRDWYCEGMCVIAIEGERERERDSAISDPFTAAAAVVMAANRRFQFRDVDRMNRSATVI